MTTADSETDGLRHWLEESRHRNPFVPHRWLTGAHRQTVFGSQQRRRFEWGWKSSSRRQLGLSDGSVVGLEEVEAGGDAPLLVLVHGMSGSSRSGYMLGLSHKAYRAGWSSARLNLYDEGNGTEKPRIFHAGCSDAVAEVVQRLVSQGRESRPIFVVGVSKGGNIVLKLLGEWGDSPPKSVTGSAVISPLVDLLGSWSLMEAPGNWIYRRYYVGRLRRLIEARRGRMEPFVDFDRLQRVRTVREFDEVVTAPLSGYRDAFDYYRDAGAAPCLDKVRVPTLILHSRDDPFLPWQPLVSPRVTGNTFLNLWLTDRGGHVAFIERQATGTDRSWAENRVIDFLDRLLQTEY